MSYFSPGHVMIRLVGLSLSFIIHYSYCCSSLHLLSVTDDILNTNTCQITCVTSNHRAIFWLCPVNSGNKKATCLNCIWALEIVIRWTRWPNPLTTPTVCKPKHATVHEAPLTLVTRQLYPLPAPETLMRFHKAVTRPLNHRSFISCFRCTHTCVTSCQPHMT